MNIFIYHPDPKQSALWLDDVRKNKMILESCQLLSTAMNVLLPNHGLDSYATSYLNHPCAIWTRASQNNFVWLLCYVKQLYLQRNKSHECSKLFRGFEMFVSHHSNVFPQESSTPFANCARNTSQNIDFTHITNVHAAYRLYHIKRWSTDKIKVTWNHGVKPHWYK
jgi:hypothetical protein